MRFAIESALPAQNRTGRRQNCRCGQNPLSMCFEANADWVTVICCADINTAKGALDVAKEFNGDVQIELTGY